MDDFYYIFQYNGKHFNSTTKKLMIVKVKNISSSFKFKEQNEDIVSTEPDYQKINTDYVGYNINTRENTPFLSNVATTIIDNSKLQDFYKKKIHKVKDNLNHYVISYLIFDKYNCKLKYFLDKLSDESVLFGNTQINRILIKLNKYTNNTMNTKNIFDVKECELLYNFLDFMYFNCSNAQIFNMPLNTTPNDYNIGVCTYKQCCENINTLFNDYLEKLKDPQTCFTDAIHTDSNLCIQSQSLLMMLLTKSNINTQLPRQYLCIIGGFEYKYDTLQKQNMHFISDFDFKNEKTNSNIYHYLSSIYSRTTSAYRRDITDSYPIEYYFTKDIPKNDNTVNRSINFNAITFVLDYKSFHSNNNNFIINNIYNKNNVNNIFKYKYTYDICENELKSDIIYLINLTIYMKTDIFNKLFLNDHTTRSSFNDLYNKYYKNIYMDTYNNKQYYIDDSGRCRREIKKVNDEEIHLSHTHIQSKISQLQNCVNISMRWITFFNNNTKTSLSNYLKHSIFYELYFKSIEKTKEKTLKKQLTDKYYKYDYSNNNRTVVMNKSDLEYFKTFISNKLHEDIYLKFKLKYENTTSCNESEFKIEPFEYQKKNAYWMGNIENKIHARTNTFNYICNSDYKFVNINGEDNLYVFKSNMNLLNKSNYYTTNHNILYDIGYVFKYDDEFKKEYIKTITLSGGILSDEVGLGKTLSTIKHIINSINTIDLDSNDDMFTYDVNNLIITPNRLVAQWYNEIKKYVTPQLFKKLNIKKITTITDIKKSLYDTSYKKHHIYIISSNLINNVNYLNYIINDEYDVKKYLEYVKNPKTPKHNYHQLITNTVVTYKDIKALLNDDILKEIEAYKIDNDKKFNIFKLKWNRIIVDEAHEVLNTHILINQHYVDLSRIVTGNTKHPNFMEFKKDELINGIKKPARIKYSLLCKLVSNFKWCLTATPFKNNIYNLYAYINFLNNDYIENINKNRTLYHTYTEQERIDYFDIENKGQNQDYDSHSYDTNGITYSCVDKSGYLINHNNNGYKYNGIENSVFGLNGDQLKCIFSDYIRKTSKSDIRGIVDIPIFTEDVTFLKQNNIERNIYLEALRSNDIVKLLKLCTHIMVSDSSSNTTTNGAPTILSLEQIKMIMITKYKKSISIYVNDLTTNTQRIEYNLEVIDSLKIIKDILKSLEFNNNNSINFIEKKSQHALDKFCSIESNSNYTNIQYDKRIMAKSYSRHNEVITTIKGIILIDESINHYKDSIDTLYDILKLIEFPKEFNTTIFKKYVCYRLYSIYSHNLTAKTTSLTKSNEKHTFEIKRLSNQIKIFENDDFISEAVKDPCSICFMDYENEIALTSCRHIMCGDCIKLLFNREHQVPCPFCRTMINRKEINFTTYNKVQKIEDVTEPQPEQSSKEIENAQKIQKYGTKLSYLLNYIGEILKVKDNRIIIFSQYDYLLKLIGGVLNDFAIKNLFINGNIMSISKKIEKFKTDDSYRIIMLSSERCSSGSNLTEASHIIFADVINGDMNFTKDMEAQAIGRAVRIGQKKPVIVKRIIMRDTIEEELYTKNKYDMLELQ